MMSPVLFNEHIQILLLSLVPGLPLVVAFSLVVRPWQKVGLRLAPWTALPALGAALFLKPGINLEVGWFFMGGRMGIDLLGQRFLLLAALVWLLAAFFGRSYLRYDKRRSIFFFFYLLSMACNFGLILAQDMLGFYLFFGLMSFSAYGLIIHNKSREARQAGKVYIILVMVGEVLLISGMLLMASRLPDLELTTIVASRPENLSLVLLFAGFAIKAGAVPLHVWLPLAHPVAPVPASAVLSGVMIKAGLLGWLRFLPVGQNIVLPGWGAFFIILGGLAAFYGVACGLGQQEAKAVLAYSSISQMGLMTIVVGCGLLAPAFWPQVTHAVSVYALHHGLAKAALFLGVGVAVSSGKERPAPWALVLLLLPALALAGLPFTSGALAKYAVKDIVHGLPLPWSSALEILLPLAAVATMVLLCHFLRILSRTTCGQASLPSGMLVPWFGLLAAVAGLLWFWPAWPLYAGHIKERALFWQGLWPVVLGLGGMVSLWKWWPGRKRLVVPAGDILWLICGHRQEGRRLPAKTAVSNGAGKMAGRWRAGAAQVLDDLGRGMEKRFMRWGVVGKCYLALYFLLLFLLLRN